ncbi:hypothetical protein VSS37_15870 [Candidatus Thiothrix sp. Deng01]|uniref:DUF2970 domain-containing protein n=1 Tax=Candidatus Thiothrix phosphatis TaxID=3112415 RepID=A0ABU6D261_9GAMM|nr:hypothetical protein [Candidatus Thiothrix sp. Deng01]MEB4592462.1 hypothetical protein [Candidatus Thiothrix sp. Deng01]
MENPAPWIEYLKHPLVLFGLALLVLASLLKLFHSDKLGAKGAERSMDKGLLYTFAAAVLIIVLGLISSMAQQQAASVVPPSEGGQSPDAVGNAGVPAQR